MIDYLEKGVTILERGMLFLVLFTFFVEKFPSNVKFRNFVKRIKSYFK